MSAFSTDPSRERALVTLQGGKRPYGARLTFQVNHTASIGELENVSVLLASGAVALLEPARSASWEGGRKFRLTLDGFATATAAELHGLRLAQALLLLATSFNIGLRLVYHGRLPATVYERFRSDGALMWGEGVIGWSASAFLEEFVTAYQIEPLDPTVTLSMELFCSALLEYNERARFVAVVSALEPLAKQEDLGESVGAYVDEMVRALGDAPGIEAGFRASMRGRIEQLRRESVRQALFRLSESWFPGRADLRHQIDRAYGLRSELLHNGTLSDPDCDLTSEAGKVTRILRAIYAYASGRTFRAPAGV
jgi:hypothetical protein